MDSFLYDRDLHHERVKKPKENAMLPISQTLWGLKKMLDISLVNKFAVN